MLATLAPSMTTVGDTDPNHPVLPKTPNAAVSGGPGSSGDSAAIAELAATIWLSSGKAITRFSCSRGPRNLAAPAEPPCQQAKSTSFGLDDVRWSARIGTAPVRPGTTDCEVRQRVLRDRSEIAGASTASCLRNSRRTSVHEGPSF